MTTASRKADGVAVRQLFSVPCNKALKVLYVERRGRSRSTAVPEGRADRHSREVGFANLGSPVAPMPASGLRWGVARERIATRCRAEPPRPGPKGARG